MHCVFVQLRCQHSSNNDLAVALYDMQIVSDLYSSSGEYDLLMKIYIEDAVDIGKYINDHVLTIPDIDRSLTTLTFKAF